MSKEIKVVIGAGEYYKGEDWIHTQEEELSLLNEEDWKKRLGPKDHPAASHKIVYNFKTITTMFEEAGFSVKLLEYCDELGQFHYHDWDEKMGFIYRSKRFDHRNNGDQLVSVSLIVDAVKPKS